jgi:hypothetical protein
MKRTIILPAVISAFVAPSPVGVALADNPHDPGTTGQPGKEAQDARFFHMPMTTERPSDRQATRSL